jgi:hypothetical protein
MLSFATEIVIQLNVVAPTDGNGSIRLTSRLVMMSKQASLMARLHAGLILH